MNTLTTKIYNLNVVKMFQKVIKSKEGQVDKI